MKMKTKSNKDEKMKLKLQHYNDFDKLAIGKQLIRDKVYV